MTSFASSESATRQSQGDGITAEAISEQLAAESGQRPAEGVATYALALGDDALMLAQRLGWWISRAPELEEDIALGNIGLDLLGHARFLLAFAGSAWGRSEDELAFFRDEHEFRSARLCEMPNGDFAHTIARQFLFAHYAVPLFRELQHSSQPTLAAIAAKAHKELLYHRDHASQWVLRLGDGTEESHRRMTDGLKVMWPQLDELFSDAHVPADAADAVVAPSSVRAEFDHTVAAVLSEATLEVPQVPQAMHDNRGGAFSEHRGYILAEMQSLARQHPGATW